MDVSDRLPQIEDEARKLGLYLEQAAAMEVAPGVPALIARFTIGDVAWSPRVQDPDNDDVDRRFGEVAAQLKDDEFLDIRSRMQRNLAAGLDALDDDDEA